MAESVVAEPGPGGGVGRTRLRQDRQRRRDQLGDGLSAEGGVLHGAAEALPGQRLNDAGHELLGEHLIHAGLDSLQALLTGQVPAEKEWFKA